MLPVVFSEVLSTLRRIYGSVCCQIPLSQPTVGVLQASFGVGNAQWPLYVSNQPLQGLLTLGVGEGSWRTQASSSSRPEANSWAVSEAPVRNSCLFLLDVGFVPGLWDAVFSKPASQSFSCSLEVLRMEREVTMSEFLGYKLQKISTGTNSKDIDLTIQNLLNKYLLSAQVP